MSNAARLGTPGTGDDGKVAVFDEANDEWDLVALVEFVEQGGRVVAPVDVSPTIDEDGTGDQTDDLNAWFATAAPGVALVAPPGARYRHAGVLVCDGRTRPRIVGYGAEFIASAQDESAFKLTDCTSPRLYGFRHVMETPPTSRGSTEDHHLIYIKDCTDLHAKDTYTEDSHAAGLLMEGVHGFRLERPTQVGGRADGLHMNAGCRHGLVTHPTSIGVGDDGVAIVSAVSASGDTTLCQGIRVFDAYVHCFPSAVADLGAGSGQGGRGLVIVGGADCHYQRGRVIESWAAGLMIATEPAYTSHSVDRCSMRGIVVERANRADALGQGAILVSSDRDGFHIDDVIIEAVDVWDQRLSGSWGGAVRVINGAGTGGTGANIAIGRPGRPIRVMGAYETTTNIQVDTELVAEVTSEIEFGRYSVTAAEAFPVLTDDAATRPDVGAVYWQDTSDPADAEAGDLWFDTDA